LIEGCSLVIVPHMKTGAWCIVFFLVFFTLAEAKYAVQQLEQVPVERVIENLEKRFKGNAGSLSESTTSLVLPLARLHVMAYVLPGKIVGVSKETGMENIWGYASPIEHFHPIEKAKGSAKDRDRALELYGMVLKKDPKNWIARLGVAWTHDQSGRRTEALGEYRAILKDSLASFDQKERGLLGYDVGAEAATYLVTMLDKKKDAIEVKQVQDEQAKLYTQLSRTRVISPLVIPNRAGLSLGEMIDTNSKVRFDLDGSGAPAYWGWLNPNSAFLVYRDRSNRAIESGFQLFGSVTFNAFWANGYDALSSLDDNGDGKISGDELRGIGLWTDANQDGISQAWEIVDAREFGITEISTAHETAPGVTLRNLTGVRFKNGTLLPSYDWMPTGHH
jgi:hypothetical protein